jgi:molecular chaperone GrpE
MSDGKNRPGDGDSGEVEIVEIVGMDEAAAPPGAKDDVEIVFDETTGVPGAEPVPDPACEEAALREKLIRLQADFENLKKRIDRDTEELYRRAARRVVSALLPVLDNLERALASARSDAGDEGIRAGVELIHRQLLGALRREGLRAVEARGLPFDPHVHEAVATEPSDELPAQTVVEELQRGYFLHDHLLRPALVKVSVEPGGAPETKPAGGEA